MLTLVVVIFGFFLFPVTIGFLFAPFIVFKRLNHDHRYDGVKFLLQSLSTQIQLIGWILIVVSFICVGLDKSPFWDIGISDAFSELKQQDTLLQIFLMIPALIVYFMLFGFLVVMNTLGLSFVLSAWLLVMISDQFSALFITDLLLKPIQSMTLNPATGVLGYVLLMYGMLLQPETTD